MRHFLICSTAGSDNVLAHHLKKEEIIITVVSFFFFKAQSDYHLDWNAEVTTISLWKRHLFP